jgi:Retrotransposon gag protein
MDNNCERFYNDEKKITWFLELMEGNAAVWAKVINQEAQARAIANGRRNGEKDWRDFQTFQDNLIDQFRDPNLVTAALNVLMEATQGNMAAKQYFTYIDEWAYRAHVDNNKMKMMIVKRGLDPELWNALVSQGVPLDNYEQFKQQAILLDNRH